MKPSLALALALVAGCGIGPTGALRIDLEAEETVAHGLAAGTTEEDVIDGWSVAYTQFVVTIGDVSLGRSSTGATASRPGHVTVDLHALPASGAPLATFDGLEVGRWDRVGFAVVPTTVASTRDASVPEPDFAEMIASGCSYLVAGAITDGAGRAVDFRLCIPAAATYGPCSTPDGMSGIAVVSAATTPAHVTMHGDHLWFTSFPSGAEAIVERRASWLAACDADGDAHVVEAELRAMPAARVFTTLDRYDLAGAPTVDGHGIVTAWDFVRAQMTTLGHFQGEGECPWAPASPGIWATTGVPFVT